MARKAERRWVLTPKAANQNCLGGGSLISLKNRYASSVEGQARDLAATGMIAATPDEGKQ
jgi:hypothetical protein